MIQGQMLPTSERGNALKEIIKKYQCKNIVEIGTWRGLGSTICIINSLLDDSNFISIETNEEFFNIAKNNLNEHLSKVTILYGKIVEEDDVNNFVSTLNLDPIKKSWLNEDLMNMSKCKNILHELPNNIDFLLLDGGEFSTYSEWNILKEKTKIVALDDIREIKTNKIYNELKLDNNYTLLMETSEGNGFAIYKKI